MSSYIGKSEVGLACDAERWYGKEVGPSQCEEMSKISEPTLFSPGDVSPQRVLSERHADAEGWQDCNLSLSLC